MYRIVACFFVLSFMTPVSAFAGEADVLSVEIEETAPRTFTITAEVEHADDGWDHYANAWQVLDSNGNVLATRELAHPHMNEQPFIRSLSNVEIPEGVSTIVIRARDLVHGFGGKEVTVNLPMVGG